MGRGGSGGGCCRCSRGTDPGIVHAWESRGHEALGGVG